MSTVATRPGVDPSNAIVAIGDAIHDLATQVRTVRQLAIEATVGLADRELAGDDQAVADGRFLCEGVTAFAHECGDLMRASWNGEGQAPEMDIFDAERMLGLADSIGVCLVDAGEIEPTPEMIGRLGRLVEAGQASPDRLAELRQKLEEWA